MTKDKIEKSLIMKTYETTKNKKDIHKHMGLFKYNAHKKGMTNAQFFTKLMKLAYKEGLIEPKPRGWKENDRRKTNEQDK